MYIMFGVLLSAVTMELGVLIGTLTRKPKSPKSSSIPKKEYLKWDVLRYNSFIDWVFFYYCRFYFL